MREAYAAHRQGQTHRAERLYEQIVSAWPDHSDALYLLGYIAHADGRNEHAVGYLRRASTLRPDEGTFHELLAQALQSAGRPAEAISSYRAALALSPDNAEASNNLGCLLSDLGDVAGAQASFEAAVRARPDLVEARFNLANLLREHERVVEAVEHYRAAVTAQPEHAKVWNNLGCALKALGRVAEAAEAFRSAVQVQADYGIGYKNLADALRELGQLEEAARNYERALELLPGDPEVSHYLDALRRANPDRASAAYVTRMFDAFARRFDDILVNKLRYDTPQVLVDTIRGVRNFPSSSMTVLDMGCGTGLFGERVRDLSRHITGVDLSPNMIEKAGQRGCYDRLIVRDLLDYLEEAERESFDLAAAVDVFVYLGDLSPVFRWTRHVLRPSALFAYSVEANMESDKDFLLLPTGRYCHSRSYLTRLAAETGFSELAWSQVALREEKGVPVQGYLCVLMRTPLLEGLALPCSGHA